ncbi:MAG TPA: hypothetical protein VIL49_09465 [Capillimicrobium sp.]
MPPFACKSCGAPSDQAAECPACGSRRFELSEESRAAAESALRPRRPAGKLVPITEAPSFKRRQRLRAS